MMRHRRHHLELRHVSGLADQQGLYSDGKGPIYRNTPARRLALRIWARETNTTYSYNYAGELWVVNYADATPDLTYTYDRRGRQTNIVASGGTALTRVYNDGGQVLSESYTGGPLNGISVTNGYDQFLRRTNLTALRTSTPLLQHSYAFDSASRLQTVSTKDTTLGTLDATYSYLAKAPLVEQIEVRQDRTVRMTTTKPYSLRNRPRNSASSLCMYQQATRANPCRRRKLAARGGGKGWRTGCGWGRRRTWRICCIGIGGGENSIILLTDPNGA